MNRMLLIAVALSIATPCSAEAWWFRDEEPGFHFELAHFLQMPTLTNDYGDTVLLGPTVELGLAGYLSEGDADDETLGLLAGNTFGVAIRAHIVGNTTRNIRPAWFLLIGATPMAEYRFVEGQEVRLPSLLSLLAPEVGVAVRPDRDMAAYIGWTATASIRPYGSDVGIEPVVRIYLIDDWSSPRIETPEHNPWEVILMVGLGVRLLP